MDLEQELLLRKSESEAEAANYRKRISELENMVSARQQHEVVLNDKLRRLERELYRMHQRKHDLVQQVRRQEAQERADGAQAAQRVRVQGGEQARKVERIQQQTQDEAMAMAYFSQPSQELAEEVNRFRMIQSLSHFFSI